MTAIEWILPGMTVTKCYVYVLMHICPAAYLRINARSNNWGNNPRLRPEYDLFWVADPWITNNLGSQKQLELLVGLSRV